MKIPNFGSTQEALAFGLANYEDIEMIDMLETAMKNLDEEISNNPNNLDCIFKRQFIRESLEAMAGIMQVIHLQFTYREAVEEWIKSI